jgi:hypothetical protein
MPDSDSGARERLQVRALPSVLREPRSSWLGAAQMSPGRCFGLRRHSITPRGYGVSGSTRGCHSLGPGSVPGNPSSRAYSVIGQHATLIRSYSRFKSWYAHRSNTPKGTWSTGYDTCLACRKIGFESRLLHCFGRTAEFSRTSNRTYSKLCWPPN